MGKGIVVVVISGERFSLPPQLDRKIALYDTGAITWLKERGSTVIQPTALRIFADELRTDTFRLTRVWHSTLEFQLTPQRNTVIIAFPIEGGMVIQSEKENLNHTGQVGEVILLLDSDSYRVATPESGARYEIELRADKLPPSLRAVTGSMTILEQTSPAIRALLISCANVALNAGIETTSPAFTPYSSAILQLLTALLLDAAPEHNADDNGLLNLHRRASALIAANFTDPELTPAELCRRLRVSPSYLRRAFGLIGTTATQEIRNARLDMARSYLSVSGRSRQEAATLSGFKDVPALLYALKVAERTT
ncbi:AraC family transcriptional regulator [Rathayibacter toxicus]|uniref:helix-turn-helix domain-containing protein n=1 Tax=Rathayibacter toxicus TaxID=145458 RepID=UPI001C662DDC|nr:AraC family transcriptional regulator [Rathayibacter toxicus]QWL53902.1 AraC family transcriptional regulator [Rathayibacter toxicus]